MFPEPTQYALFIAGSLALLLTPGPAVLYIVTRSVDQGRRAGVVSVLGIQVGTLFHVLAAALGLSAILVSSALAFDIVKYLGAGYLIYLGVRKLLSPEHNPTLMQNTRTDLRRAFSQGVIVNVLNPKTALFFFAFLPQFVVVSRGSVPLQMITLGVTFCLLGLCTDSMYALLSGTAGTWLRRSRTFWRFERFFAGSVYIGLGIFAALSGSNKKT
jgi:threonine/homoserine/homoserine lactone efflux protein